MRDLDPERLGVYVVTSSAFGRSHLETGLAAVDGGATAVQLRAPELDDDALLRVARKLAEACAAAGVLFVVNDRVRVAAEVGAGAHVGQGDDPAGARRLVGEEAVLGISVGGADEARAAETAGADYLGVTVWSTTTKPEAVARGIEGLEGVVAATWLPVVGIGGIDASNAAEVLAAGAAGIAVVSAVGGAEDPVAATRRLVETVTRWKAGER